MDRIIDKSELADQIDAALADVRAGHSVTITSDGAPLAKLVPPTETLDQDDEAARERRVAAIREMIKAAEKRGVITVGPWTREQLYEREPWPDGPPCA